mmetsp:Transcript_3416/g.5797  ORF Transcript_3416/g.5797 Transcript_3416/m.5797 type:complete len:167 (+) Transcript_3416:154-654(+)
MGKKSKNIPMASAFELCEAAAEGDLDGCRRLLHKGKVPVNCVDEANWTPLHNAAYNGDDKIIMLLLSQPGIDVNATDNMGTTPFMNVALSGNMEAVELMLSAPGIDLTKKDNQGKTAAKYAKERGVKQVYDLVKAEEDSAFKRLKGAMKKAKAGAARLSMRLSLRG